MTLDEAKAAFEATLRYEDTEPPEPLSVDFDAIRAAVRDIPLATIQYLANWRAENELAVPIHGFSETEDEINRVFGEG